VASCAPEGRTGSCRALDRSIRFGQSYEYRAQRVARVTVNGKTLELDGELSAPVRVEARDIFPPAVPTGLVAVATIGENAAEPPAQNGAKTAIDLSWQPVADANLAGYIVYRYEGGRGRMAAHFARRAAGSPAFHDSQVQPGHTYRYAVSAIGQNGHESPRSAEAGESVPTP
jgi:fibronectin type 3 domain-containing protein